jgi:hypothetical protein
MFEYEDKVLQCAEYYDLSREKLDTMVAGAARITHDFGNRRFHDWLFLVEGNHVIKMRKLASMPPQDTIKLQPNEFICWEDCELCEGEGCPTCDFQGSYRFIRKMKKPKTSFGVMH